MVELLKRYVEHDMDQWELWKFDTKRSTVFVNVSLYPAEGAAEDAYTDLSDLVE